MSARFRIPTSGGQELSFASHAVFAEFVRSGDLSPDDVVYDAETREWSSARTHPVVLQIEVETEEAKRTEPEPPAAESLAPPSTAPTESPTLTFGNIGLELAPAQDRLTPEQESAAFVAKMEAERAADLDLGDEAPIAGFTMEGASGLAGQIAEPGTARRPEARPVRHEAPVRQPEPVRHEPPAWEEPPARPQPPKRKKTGSGAGRRYAPFVILLVALGGAGVYFGPELLVRGRGVDEAPGQDSVVVAPTPAPLIADNEEPPKLLDD
ncbi:MAG: hypothetical protein EXR91_13335 [Gemmatimonadetes bacterium]|nr:hypothetical protein [Gemmatimonadota bacterium]